jgi:hypothetical protein
VADDKRLRAGGRADGSRICAAGRWGREEKEREIRKKMVRPVFEGGFGGPLGIKVWRENLEGHAK